MSVVIETTLGDVTVDLFIKERPRASLNFLKLCKIKYYNYNLFHMISRGFIAQTGDPTGSRNGGESVFGVIGGPSKRYFESEKNPRIKHTMAGLISFVGNDEQMIGSQFFLTLGSDLMYLDDQHCVFGEVTEGHDVLDLLNEVICDQDNRPYQDVRVTHTVVLDDPFPDPEGIIVPCRSPSPTMERLQGGRIAPDEEIDELYGKSMREVNELIAEKEAKARATILEMIGDIPDAEMAPPENVLFVCKLNPVTTDDDLEIIFGRFGRIKSCEVIRDKKTDESLQYAFVEFEDEKACEDAYFKMDNVLIDDRRIHVDFSQSVAKVRWHGKGRGVTTYDDDGRKDGDKRNDLGKGRFDRKPSIRSTKQFDLERNQSNRHRSERMSNQYRSRSSYDEGKYKEERQASYRSVERSRKDRSRPFESKSKDRIKDRSRESIREDVRGKSKERMRVRSKERHRNRSRSKSKERVNEKKRLVKHRHDKSHPRNSDQRIKERTRYDKSERDKERRDRKRKKRKVDSSSSSSDHSSSEDDSSSGGEQHKRSRRKEKKKEKNKKKKKKNNKRSYDESS